MAEGSSTNGRPVWLLQWWPIVVSAALVLMTLGTVMWRINLAEHQVEVNRERIVCLDREQAVLNLIVKLGLSEIDRRLERIEKKLSE